jgi:hypothetical protein
MNELPVIEDNPQCGAVRGKLDLPVERDRHYRADKTISAHPEEARSRGHIVT